MHPWLETFEAEVRRHTGERAGLRFEVRDDLVRARHDDGESWILWSRLDEATADAAIEREVARHRAEGGRLEWKLYDYDTPPDLERRLVAAGFTREDDESLMVAEAAAIPPFEAPDGVAVVEVADTAGLDRVIAVHDAVFGEDHAGLRAQIAAQLEAEPESLVLVLAVAGDRAVSAARLELPPSGSFASLWGGGTLPEWRGRGIYRALVSRRAAIAAARGFRFVYVDASDDSRPILERLGFVRLARTTPYVLG